MKNGQQHHPDEYAARVVLWADNEVVAKMVWTEALRLADARRLALAGSCVALTVAGARALLFEAAGNCRVLLVSPTPSDTRSARRPEGAAYAEG